MPTEILKPIGILGGTFDPIHHGHLRVALEAYYHLELDHVRLIPLKTPAHRDAPIANSAQRSEMIKLAVYDVDYLTLDERELNRETNSYTIDTLISLRKEFHSTPLCLLMGQDSFSTLDKWKDWQHLLDYAHIVVASRHQKTNHPFNSTIESLLQSYEILVAQDLHKKSHGMILRMEIPLLDISSSGIRNRIKYQQELSYLLPKQVIDYIQLEKIYASN